MGNLGKKIGLMLVVSVIFSGTVVFKAEALSLNPLMVIIHTTDVITRRVSDIVYYLVMQKRYIFDNFVDPNNNYTTWTNSDNLDKVIIDLSAATTTKKTVSVSPQVDLGRPISITTTTIPAVTQTSSASSGSNGPEILRLTNLERRNASLSPLAPNFSLDQIASLRADDLFANQYFEHESPDGKSATDLAAKVGYNYLMIGENLALGNYDGDQGIVTAWMNSPGHRANILNGKYQELGVSVKRDMYNHEPTTIAVQIFGTPLSSCARPDPNTKASIESSSATITQMQTEARAMYDNLTALNADPKIDRSYYNQKVQEYNYFAKKINDAVLTLKGMVDSYNLQVSKYNACLRT
jgi:uncharacterized protein YkwD